MKVKTNNQLNNSLHNPAPRTEVSTKNLTARGTPYIHIIHTTVLAISETGQVLLPVSNLTEWTTRVKCFNADQI